MDRRDISKVLFAGSAGLAVLAPTAYAQTCTPPCYPIVPAETAAGVTPSNLSYEPGNVRRYGAVGDDSAGSVATNNTAFTNARAVAIAAGGPLRVVFPAGIYRYSASPNWGVSGIALEAVGHVELHFTGTGDAWVFDGGPNQSDDIYNCRMTGDFTINGTASAANGLYIRGIHHSRFEARIRNVTQAGCDINFCVGSSFKVQTTIGKTLFTTTPTRGYYIKGRTAGEYTAWCQFHQTVIDSCSGFGIDILHASGCSFYGGFVNTCGGGVRVDSVNFCQNNSFYDIDFEDNSIYDVVLYGQHNRLVGCTTFSNATNNNLIVGAGASGTQIIGGFIKICTLQSGSEHTLFLNASFADTTTGITGGNGYQSIGCYLVNSSAVRTGNLPDVFGPNISLPGIPTSATGLPAGSLWRDGNVVKIV